AYPTAAGDIAVAGRVQASGAIADDLPTRSQSTFGVERKTPRGAFLWPQATVAALKLDASAPDGQQSMSVAALELLAAQTVAELGTYAALSEPAPIVDGVARSETARDAVAGGVTASGAASQATATPMPTAARTSGSSEQAVAVEPSESDVLQAA